MKAIPPRTKPVAKSKIKQAHYFPVGVYRAARLLAVQSGHTMSEAVTRGLELYIQHGARWRRFVAQEERHPVARRRGRVGPEEV